MRHKVLSAAGAVVGLLVILAAIGAVVGDGPASEAATSAQPTLQDQFVSIVEQGQSAAESADNEIAVVQARHARAKALCHLLPDSLKVSGWRGTVDDISTTLGGDSGVLAIDLGNDIALETWNNAVSDLGDHTLIATDGPMYRKLATLKEGDEVVFSGQFIGDPDKCINEQSLIDENGMESPDFTFRFATVTKAR